MLKEEPTYNAGLPAPDSHSTMGAREGGQQCLKELGGRRPEHAGQRSFEALLFCGFEKSVGIFLAASHVLASSACYIAPHPEGFTSGAKQPRCGVTCLIKLAYKRNGSTEGSAEALRACRRACV